ncbi:MAG: hypothetical protein DIU80_006350 [Chloroflexota bacterium]|nr:MAG: hypothetical protein DIU80_03490 [Chloroflexota bacterium]
MAFHFRLLGRAASLALLAALLIGHAPTADAQAGERCFPETGYCISGRIREFWEQNGGLPVFGFPIDPQGEEMIEGRPVQVQWFERTRLELHPENPPPYDVLLGRLGVDRLEQQGRDWRTFPTGPLVRPVPCRDFPETRHAVCGAFLEYFRSHGLNFDGRPGISEHESIALFGMPVSDEMVETLSDGRQYTVQWFERARFEYHPENPEPYKVLLGLLGNEVHEQHCSAPIPDSLQLAYRRTQFKTALGCPVFGSTSVPAARQQFEGGEMIWIAPLHNKDGRIFVRFEGEPATYRLFIDTTWAGEPDLSSLTPPPNRVVPRSGFGKVWYENSDVREALGWAYTPEMADTADVQIFDRGTIVRLHSLRIGSPLSNVPAAIVFGPRPTDVSYVPAE